MKISMKISMKTIIINKIFNNTNTTVVDESVEDPNDCWILKTLF